MSTRVSLYGLVVLIFFMAVTFYPFLMVHFVWKTPRDIEIDPEFISGLIALSGILLGFVTAILTIKRDKPSILNMMLLMNWALLWYAATSLFGCALGQTSPVDAATWATCSLTSNHFTAGCFLVMHVFSRRQKNA